jgi:O-antigen/teichoic acid export membrane protein
MLLHQSGKFPEMKTLDASMWWLPKRLLANQVLKNVSANLIGCGWNGVLILLATPWYVSLLGMEGYGLVGFWLLMQVLFSLFDFGLGATLSRELAASAGHKDSTARQRNLLRTIEYIYWPWAVLISLSIFIFAHLIANSWLNLTAISTRQTVSAIQWMGIALGLQFPCMLYSSGLAGLQCQGRMNVLQIFGNSLRHGGGVLVLFWRPDPVLFFLVQAIVACVQTVSTGSAVWHVVNKGKRDRPALFRLELLGEVWRFSTGMALTMISGVILANVDRLFLSKLLAVEELGKYTLAWTVTGFLQIGIQPFYRAYFPRFSELVAAGDKEKLRQEYYQGCRLTAWVIVPFSLIGLVFANEIFWVWIGKRDETVVGVFRWLMIGVAGSGLMWLPAAFQQAHGWTRLHALMIAGALGIGVPLLWWAIENWGTVGGTTVWVLHGISDITLGLWLMHRRLLPGELNEWYRTVLLMPLIFCLPIIGLSWWLMPAAMSRWSAAGWLTTTCMLMAFSICFFSKFGNFRFR